MNSSHPYSALTPDCALDALDRTGLHADGRLLALNSYENRVYQMGVEDSAPVVVKFYRPERWSDADVTWKVELAGEGQSTPVLFDGRIYLTYAKPVDGKAARFVACLDQVDGKLRWEKQASLTAGEMPTREARGPAGSSSRGGPGDTTTSGCNVILPPPEGASMG